MSSKGINEKNLQDCVFHSRECWLKEKSGEKKTIHKSATP